MDSKRSADSDNIVLLNTFLIDSSRYRVFYNDQTLIWEKEKSRKGKCKISPWV